jgi:hypothetical protein
LVRTPRACKAARDRNRIKNGKRVKVEGRKSHAEERPEAVKEARRLRRVVRVVPANGSTLWGQ